MNALRNRTLASALVLLALAGPVRSAVPTHVVLDRFGDALPPGAVLRLGSARFREAGYCRSVAFAPMGDRIASAGPKGVALWDALTGKRLAVFHPAKVRDGDQLDLGGVAISADGRRVAAIPHRGAVQVWDTDTGNRTIVAGLYGRAAFVCFTPDGNEVVALLDYRLRIASLAKPDECRDGPNLGPDHACLNAAASADCRSLAVVTREEPEEPEDKKFRTRVFDLATMKPRRADFLPGGRRGVALSADGGSIALDDEGPTFRVLDATTGKVLATVTKAAGEAFHGEIAMSPDAKVVAVGGMLYDTATGKVIARDGPEDSLSYMKTRAFSPDGRTLAVESPTGVALAMREARTGEVTRSTADFGHTDDVNAVAYSRDGRTLVTFGRDDTLRLWDARDGRPLLSMAVPCDWTDKSPPAFSPDGALMAVRVGYGVRLFDTKTGRTRHILADPEERWIGAANVTFSADGRVVSAGSELRHRWDVVSGELLSVGRSASAGGRETAGALAPDGTTVYQENYRIVVRDAKGRHVRTMDEVDGGRWSGSYRLPVLSPDGSLVAAATRNGIHVWRYRDGKNVSVLVPRPVFRDAIVRRELHYQPSFSPDGRLLAGCCEDGRLVVWDTATAGERRTLALDAEHVAFAPDGRSVAVGGNGAAALVVRVAE